MACLQVDFATVKAQRTVDILHLAFNNSHHNVASLAARELLSRVKDPDVVLPMLQTAVARGHHQVLHIARLCPAAQRLLPPAILKLMWAAVDQMSPEASAAVATGVNPLGMLQDLVRYSAADLLVSEEVLPLLKSVLLQGCSNSAAVLCTLPAVAYTAHDDFISLLELGMARGLYPAVRALCSLPVAATAVTTADLLPTMRTAAASKTTCSFVEIRDPMHLASSTGYPCQ